MGSPDGASVAAEARNGQQSRSFQGGALIVVQSPITGQRFAPPLRRQIARMHTSAEQLQQLNTKLSYRLTREKP